MLGFLLKRVVLPIVLLVLIYFLSGQLIPQEYAQLRLLPTLVFLIALVYWWLTSIARWFARRFHWRIVAYLINNLAIALVITGALLTGSYLLAQYNSIFATPVKFLGWAAGAAWMIWSIIYLFQRGQRRRSKNSLWQWLSGWLEQSYDEAKPAPAKKQQAAPGAAISPRPSVRQNSAAAPTREDIAYDFVRQGQEWATRQEYVGNYASFESNLPTYRQMTLAQQQWYFFWRTQVRQGKILATDPSYLFVYVYELLNVIGVNSPTEAQDRLAAFWQAYRAINPKLDNYLVDWVADFGILNRLSPSPLPWYAHALAEGAKGKRLETLLLEAWHQEGRDYAALPPAFLYSFVGYATDQNKFYQAFQNELSLDDSLKRGIEVIDGYVQETQRRSLYELHLPTPTQTVVRPPLNGAVHRYPPTPLVIASVRPWQTEATLRDDLKAILRYTENILRSQAAYKTKLRGVSLPSAWATVLDQAFIKAPPKRIVSIDPAGAQALQRESDELRQRLLEGAEDEVETPAPLGVTPAVEEVPSNAQPSGIAAIQRPADAPDGLLTDLPALVAIMGSADSEATGLLRSLRAHTWQGTPDMLQQANKGEFVNVIFDRVNERAITELGDALIFIEGEEWVVAEDYWDEIAYLLDHPAFAGTLLASSAASTGTSGDNVAAEDADTSPQVEHLDTIPAGWEDFVRQMRPITWATLAIVTEGADVMAKLEALARDHYFTASQLLDQANETSLDAMGDNLIDVTTTPPQMIEEYVEALQALLLWAKENHQIEGVP